MYRDFIPTLRKRPSSFLLAVLSSNSYFFFHLHSSSPPPVSGGTPSPDEADVSHCPSHGCQTCSVYVGAYTCSFPYICLLGMWDPKSMWNQPTQNALGKVTCCCMCARCTHACESRPTLYTVYWKWKSTPFTFALSSHSSRFKYTEPTFTHCCICLCLLLHLQWGFVLPGLLNSSRNVYYVPCTLLWPEPWENIWADRVASSSLPQCGCRMQPRSHTGWWSWYQLFDVWCWDEREWMSYDKFSKMKLWLLHIKHIKRILINLEAEAQTKPQKKGAVVWTCAICIVGL